MKQTINLSQFRDEFQAIRPNNFSYEGLESLYEYFEEFDPDMELDVIAICCDFCEMTMDEIFEAYPDVLDLIDMDRPTQSTYSIVVDYLNDNGSYCGDTPQGTFVFQQF
jgi:hypothetical protein